MLHLSHPAHPTRDQLDAEAKATARDLRDFARITAIECIVSSALDAVLPFATDDLEHPDAEFSLPGVLAQLLEWREDIRLERARLRGPLVIGE